VQRLPLPVWQGGQCLPEARQPLCALENFFGTLVDC
jgi:hypothetical protein